jgi:hypothetical protein
MARATADEAAARREQVEHLSLRGARPSVIARAIGSDARTVRRDLRVLAKARAAESDLASERLRLLAAAKGIELEAWQLLARLSAGDVNGRLGCLSRALAAQDRQAALVSDQAAADLAARVSNLEQRVNEAARGGRGAGGRGGRTG